MDSAHPDEDDRTVIRPAGTSSAPIPLDSPRSNDPLPGNDEQHNALAVGTMLGEFEILKVIGEGGFGIVYLAQDTSLKRRVALKEYMPCELAARRNNMQIQVLSERHRETFEMGMRSFINEAHVLAQFDHPSLVRVHRFWEANGTAYMVMPFVEGTTLKDKLKQLDGRPEEQWLMSVLAPLTEALAVIHAEHCYHRDIAPDNIILLAGTGRPLLLDFGAARRVIGDRTQALTAILKHGYAPIEQYAEAPGMKQGPWTDVYALGALLYFAITGSTPPPSVARILNDSYEPLAEVAAGKYSPEFLAAIDHSLRVRPEDRTQTIEQFRQELGIDGSIDHGRTVFQPAVPVPPPGAPAPKAHPRTQPGGRPSVLPGDEPAGGGGKAKLWMALGGIGIVAVGTAAVLMTRGGAPTPTPAPPPIAATPASAPASAVATAPAPAPPPAAPTPPPAPPFTMAGEFDKIQQAQAANFVVEAAPARTQLRIGKDKLSFKIQSTREGYVYVLWNDPDGALYLMYPNKKATANRVTAGKMLTLPGADWQLDTVAPTGQAHLLVIVSEKPRQFDHLSLGFDFFHKLPTGPSAAALAREYTGPGSVLAGRAQCEGPNCDVYGTARFDVEVVQ